MNRAELLRRRIRWLTWVMIIGLVVSGATAIPLRFELNLAGNILRADPTTALGLWLGKIREGRFGCELLVQADQFANRMSIRIIPGRVNCGQLDGDEDLFLVLVKKLSQRCDVLNRPQTKQSGHRAERQQAIVHAKVRAGAAR